jgi:ribonuclease P protein component
MKQTFTKAERLCSKALMEKLFHGGHTFTLFPFRVLWLEEKLDSPFPVQIAFSVPKRNFKRAVDRNLLKRRSREAYRKNKFRLYEFLQLHNQSITLLLVYITKEKILYDIVENKINQVIDRLCKDSKVK